MRFDTKIAIVLRDDLETWQKLNVTAFLASGVAANPELLGEPYADADGTLSRCVSTPRSPCCCGTTCRSGSG